MADAFPLVSRLLCLPFFSVVRMIATRSGTCHFLEVKRTSKLLGIAGEVTLDTWVSS